MINPKKTLNLLSQKRYWINSEYLKCLEMQLPSKCFKSKIYALSIDSLGAEIYTDGIESFYTDIMIDDNKIFIVTKDTLYLELDDINQSLLINNEKYISKDSWIRFNNISEVIMKVNGDVFFSLYSEQLSSFFTKKSFVFFYNPYESVHFVGNSLECNDVHMVDFTKDSVFIYKPLDYCKGKSILKKDYEKKTITSFKRYY